MNLLPMPGHPIVTTVVAVPKTGLSKVDATTKTLQKITHAYLRQFSEVDTANA